MSDDLTRLRELRAKANEVITAMTLLVNELDAMLAAEPEPAPAPYVVTDAMIEAVWRHNTGSALITRQMPFAQIDVVWRQQIRAALEAAERARRTGGQG